MALPVDRAQSNAMNLQVLKRQDESVVDIVDMASHVVVYEFDQALQSWKRKDVEGCLFVVKRYASPRFQIFVNNRLSTTNMTIPVDNRLEVDSVDTFLILRSPDATAAGGYAIYGLWFFPEEDREKILKLLQRMVRSVNEPSAPATPTTATTKTSKPKSVVDDEPQQQPEPEVTLTQPPVVVTPSSSDGTQKQPRQPRQRAQNAGQRGGRGRSKRENATTTSKPTTPTTILQRPQTEALVDGVRDQLSIQEPAQQQQQANGNAAMYTPISREEGIAAGNAILGMLGGHTATQPPPQNQPRSRTSSGTSNGQAAVVSKEQLKQTLIALLDEPQFFDQIYHAYVSRTRARS